MKNNEMVDIFAISQSAPGAIGVNSAICIGYHLAGIAGALVANDRHCSAHIHSYANSCDDYVDVSK